MICVITDSPSSPPAMEKSSGSIDHLWIVWARDVAFELTRRKPFYHEIQLFGHQIILWSQEKVCSYTKNN